MQIFAAASAAAGVDCFSDWKFVVVWIFWAANLVLDNWAVSRRRDFGQFRSLRKARLLQQAINVFLLLSSLSFTTIVCFEGHVKYMYEWVFFFWFVFVGVYCSGSIRFQVINSGALFDWYRSRNFSAAATITQGTIIRCWLLQGEFLKVFKKKLQECPQVESFHEERRFT